MDVPPDDRTFEYNRRTWAPIRVNGAQPPTTCQPSPLPAEPAKHGWPGLVGLALVAFAVIVGLGIIGSWLHGRFGQW